MRRGTRLVVALSLLSTMLTLGAVGAQSAGAAEVRGRYANALKAKTSAGTRVESCSDPSVLRGRGRFARYWYMYCTSDPLSDRDTSGAGAPTFRRLPMMRSRDLVHWRYVGSALPGKPSWASASAQLWAPDVVYSSTYKRYYMTYAVTDTVDRVSRQPGCAKDPAIGVATSATPTGPWRMGSVRGPAQAARRRLLVRLDHRPRRARPEHRAQRGPLLRRLPRRDLRAADPLSKYAMKLTGCLAPGHHRPALRGGRRGRRGGYYYLFVSSGSCCTGPLSGYSVFAGRSRSPFGPVRGPGGQPAHRGSCRRHPGARPERQPLGGRRPQHRLPGLRRPVVDGLPRGRQGPAVLRRPSRLHQAAADARPDRLGRRLADGPVGPGRLGRLGCRAPAAQPASGRRTGRTPVPHDALGAPMPEAHRRVRRRPPSTRAGPGCGSRPTRRRTASAAAASASRTQAGGLTGDADGASVLTEPAPAGSYVVQTVVRLDVPADGCCQDYVQGGLAIYGSDDRFLKLTHVSAGRPGSPSSARRCPRRTGLPALRRLHGRPARRPDLAARS